MQLYELTDDFAESKNVQAAQPEIVARLMKLLEGYVANGRSTPGAKQSNDAPIDLAKANAKVPKE